MTPDHGLSWNLVGKDERARWSPESLRRLRGPLRLWALTRSLDEIRSEVKITLRFDEVIQVGFLHISRDRAGIFTWLIWN